MIDSSHENISFYLGEDDSEQRSPIQNLIYEVINLVNFKIKQGYINNIQDIERVQAPDMLIMVTANIFANISHHIMATDNMNLRLDLFRELQEGFNNISSELFLALQTYFADETTSN